MPYAIKVTTDHMFQMEKRATKTASNSSELPSKKDSGGDSSDDSKDSKDSKDSRDTKDSEDSKDSQKGEEESEKKKGSSKD